MIAAIEHETDDTEADNTLVGDPWSRSGERPVARPPKPEPKKRPDVRERLARRTTSGVVSVASVERAKAASAPAPPRPAPPASPTVPDVADLAEVAEPLDLAALPPAMESAPPPPPPPVVAALPPPAPPPVAVRPAPIAFELPAPAPEVDLAYEEALRGMSAGALDGVTRVLATSLLFVVLVVVGVVRLPFQALALVARFLAARWTRAAAIVAGRGGR